jgi:hypothetical protein
MDGFTCKRKEKWRAKDLGVEEFSKSDFNDRFLMDLKELDVVISATKGSCNKTRKAAGKNRGKFAKRKGTFDPLTIAYLVFAWGVGKNHAARVREKGPPGPSNPEPTRKQNNASRLKSYRELGGGEGEVHCKGIVSRAPCPSMQRKK